MTLPLLALLGFIAVCATGLPTSVARTGFWCRPPGGPQQLPAANARIELARTVAFASGPALGGVLGRTGGCGTCVRLRRSVVGYGVVLLSGIYEPAARARIPPPHPLQDIKEGAVFVLHHRLLRPVFITQFISTPRRSCYWRWFVPYAVRHLRPSATGVRARPWRMYGFGTGGRARCCDAGDEAAPLRYRDRTRGPVTGCRRCR